jgi:hypothetical protein
MTYDTVRFVDLVGGNFLFRGGETITADPNTGDAVFDYQGLKAAMANAPNLPRPLPPSYYLVVINLEHPDERQNLTAEIAYFAYNKQQGQLHLWDTNGTAQCYYRTDPEQRDVLAANLEQWLPDPLIWRVATVRNWLEGTPLPTPAPPAMPIIIYVHCDGGCDRTSELIGAYRLRHMPQGWTMQTAWMNMYNEHPCTLPMGCNNYMAVQWYAFWLNRMQGYALTGIGDDGGCNDAGTQRKKCSPLLF